MAQGGRPGSAVYLSPGNFTYEPVSPSAVLGPLWSRTFSFDFPKYHSRLLDQAFGEGLAFSDFGPPTSPGGYALPRRRLKSDKEGFSEVKVEDGKFVARLDVSAFSSGDLTVKTIDNKVHVHGKHEETQDQHGLVSREFNRQYLLPEGVDPLTVTSNLSEDGVLTVEAPLPKPVEDKPRGRVVSVLTTQVGPATQKVEEKQEHWKTEYEDVDSAMGFM
ncbi:alpha-crystallin B chain-like [Branchiostoma floridae]|uniref:Alpha-crystallin B chain-like n=1 Tax=Branchiostoma floridae TaxID=7739 RepID=C3XVH9_BRAFL|nr:alpha-crystallin B chain-like [Branchiostoma floridae]|eukprot:XP_002612096.1 hypothetical protein BRAFLDRAFT_130907 [Branchiostoma floridae]